LTVAVLPTTGAALTRVESIRSGTHSVAFMKGGERGDLELKCILDTCFE
jgi:hypothetical protein